MEGQNALGSFIDLVKFAGKYLRGECTYDDAKDLIPEIASALNIDSVLGN